MPEAGLPCLWGVRDRPSGTGLKSTDCARLFQWWTEQRGQVNRLVVTRQHAPAKCSNGKPQVTSTCTNPMGKRCQFSLEMPKGKIRLQKFRRSLRIGKTPRLLVRRCPLGWYALKGSLRTDASPETQSEFQVGARWIAMTGT